MERTILKYEPSWEGVFENYARSWIVRHGWRVRQVVGDENDQLQECAMVFAKLRDRYEFQNAPHFMSMFKTALFRHWAKLSPKDWQKRNLTQDLEIPDWYWGPSRFYTPDASNEGSEQGSEELAAATLSEELQAVLRIIADTPAELLEFVMGIDNERDLERRLCWLAGVPFRAVLKELREVLS